jgi:chromosome segregation ATPase
MDQTLQRIIERLNTALKLTDLITYSESQAALSIAGVRGRLEGLLLQYTDMGGELPVRQDQVDPLRETIASIRAEMRECHRALDPLKTESAEHYRITIGEQKESFERLTDKEQKQRNSVAHKFKQKFNNLAGLQDVLDLISADLMTLSGVLERHELENKKTPGIGHYESNDNTPANPSLSP